MSRPNKIALFFAVCAFAGLSGRAQNACNHPTPSLVAPSNGATGVTSPVTFTWTATPGALGYEVWASVDGGGYEQVGGTGETQLVADLDPDIDVEWYVVTNFAECKNESTHAKFHSAACGSSAAVLVSPPDGATLVSSPVRFAWHDVPKAAGYRLWIASATSDFETLGDADSSELTSRLDPGTYTWFVETFFDNCASTESDPSTFTIPLSQSCSGAAATLTSPPNGSQQTTAVHFAWAAVPGAIAYNVFAALDDGDFQFIDETDTATSLDAGLTTGHIRWAVVAEFNGCYATVSSVGEFDIPFNPDCDINSPLLIAPADGDRDVAANGADFIWTPVDGAIQYEVWATVNNGPRQFLGATTSTRLRATVPANADIAWRVETKFANCPTDRAPESSFRSNDGSNICRTPVAPELFIDAEAMSGQPYTMLWSPGSGTASYEVQESSTANFANAPLQTSEVIATFSHSVTTPTRYYYRVRSNSSCGAGFGPFSGTGSIVVLPGSTSESNAAAVGAYGARTVVQTLHVAGSTPPVLFTASVDKPWLTVSPSSGTLGPDGVDFTVTAATPDLAVGTSSATITINRTNASVGGGRMPLDAGSVSVPISVSLVTPVTPNPGNSPIPESLIIPAVAHAEGASARFESDIRVANAGAQTMKYLLTFTPSASDGTKVGKQTTIQVEPGETVALSDILKNFFGFAAAGDSVTGVLEIRPIVSNGMAAQATTFASSRTFAVTPNGTFGQFVPAIPFANFIGKTKDPSKPSIISLQQVAQSAKYRTNLGVVEASGEPATVDINVFAGNGAKLGSTFTLNLKPGEHRQLGNFLSTQGISADDARIEVSVTSATGRVTAYASVLDNLTNDPLLVLPVNPNNVSASRFILPGIADLNTGASWRSDIRLFNAGAASVDATLTYYPQNDPLNAKSINVNLPGGQVYAIDDALRSRFGITNSGGSVLVTTPQNAKIVATARTYNQTSSGTYGQFIPGVTASDGVGLGQRALQILQVEESPRFRTNVGIVELTGKPATVEISAITPDSKVAVKTQVELRPNEFTQLNSLLRRLGLPATYNTRVTLKVIAGTGRVTGYASLIDNRTQDPTYVPAQ